MAGSGPDTDKSTSVIDWFGLSVYVSYKAEVVGSNPARRKPVAQTKGWEFLDNPSRK